MQCKQCGARLEPDMELCPECGIKIEQEEQVVCEPIVTQEEPVSSVCEEQKAEPAPKKKGQAIKIALSVVMVVALLCMMVLVVFKDDALPGHWTSAMEGTVPQNGDPENVTSQGSYTGSVWELMLKKDTVVAKVGNMSLTNGQLQVLFNTIRNTYAGDTESSWDSKLALDRQICALDESLTWQQFLLKTALEGWETYAVLYQKAQEEGFELTEEQQAALDGVYDSLYKNYVESGKYASVDKLIQQSISPGCDFQTYLDYTGFNSKTLTYYSKLIEEQAVTEEDIEAYFKDNEELFTQNDIKKDGSYVVNVRHILVGIEELTGKTTDFTDEDWEYCEKEAQKILGWWLEKDVVDEESFGNMAAQFSDDPGSKSVGGLYTDVYQGEMVENFDAWCFDESRKPGDYGIVKSSYGYHIMYFCSAEETWHSYSRQGAAEWLVHLALMEMVEEAELKVDYKKIALWEPAYSN